MTPSPHTFRSGWLLWLALAILFAGGVLIYGLSRQEFNPDAQKTIVFILWGSIASAGLCIIAATAGLWFRR